MQENNRKELRRWIVFEGSGEMISVEIVLENISPRVEKTTLVNLLDQLYEEIKEEALKKEVG